MTDTSLEALFAAAANGDAVARQQIFVTVYAELHRLAERELRRQGPQLTISPTTLLHDAYLDLQARTGTAFPDRAHFLAYASRAMRGLIVDHARRRMAQKRGGGLDIRSLETRDDAELPVSDADLESIGEALEELASHDERLAEVVDLKFFCGLTFAEIAALRQVSERTVQRDWEKARLLLFRALNARN